MTELQARLAWEVVALLVGRFAKFPERKRPYFTSAQRCRILEIKNLLGWSADKGVRLPRLLRERLPRPTPPGHPPPVAQRQPSLGPSSVARTPAATCMPRAFQWLSVAK